MKSPYDTLNDTLKCSITEWAVIQFLKENPKATQKEIAAKIGKSEITVKRITSSLASEERSVLKRINGKRDGWWKVQKM